MVVCFSGAILCGNTVGGCVVLATARKESTLRFDRFEVDVGRGELRKDGQVIRLQPQPLQLLLTLLGQPGLLVSREDLRESLWPKETFVDFEDGLH